MQHCADSSHGGLLPGAPGKYVRVGAPRATMPHPRTLDPHSQGYDHSCPNQASTQPATQSIGQLASQPASHRMADGVSW